MIYGLALTIVSIIYLIILLMVYYSKRYFENIQADLYRIMMYAAIAFIVFQVTAVFTAYDKSIEFITYITCRASWSACIIWYVMFYFYFLAFVTKDESTSIVTFLKKRKSCLAICIVMAIFMVVYFALPFPGLDPNNLIFLPGSSMNRIYIVGIFLDLIFLYMLIKNKEKISRNDKLVMIFSMIVSVVVMVFQAKYANILVIPLGLALIMYSLYFTTEDPDLAILKNTMKVREEVEKSNQVKLDFISNVSYEIKNPMDSITSLTETLLNVPFSPNTAKSYLKQICDSGSDLLDITNNILDMSVIETGNNLIKNKNYNVAEMIVRLVEIIKNKLGYSKIHFNVSIDTDMPSVLYGDESKVYQCVLNILTNAVKYTEIGKINFSVNFNRESNNTIRILFKVMDTGIGIKDEDAKYLFKKFSRLDDAVSKEIEGSGLGLTIAKRYVDLMGGKIWFESQHLAGSTFYIELVQGIVDPTPIRSIKFNTEKPNYGAGLDCSNYKLLVVDDNELNVRVLSRLLERYKLKFDAVENGDKCIEAIKAETKYDLIFMDDSLPNISGTETMQILRKLMGDDLPPVVVITANAIVGMKDAYIAQGFSDYISKPIDMNELDRVINKFLKK